MEVSSVCFFFDTPETGGSFCFQKKTQKGVPSKKVPSRKGTAHTEVISHIWLNKYETHSEDIRVLAQLWGTKASGIGPGCKYQPAPGSRNHMVLVYHVHDGGRQVKSKGLLTKAVVMFQLIGTGQSIVRGHQVQLVVGLFGCSRSVARSCFFDSHETKFRG